MKRQIFILCLASIVVIASSCGRNSQKAKQAELERIQRMQDSARQADAAIMMQLQMKAKMDSIAALSQVAAKEFSTPSTRSHSSYYVIVGSFLNRSNAVEYMQFVKQMFPDATVLRYGRWNMVAVGGTYSNFSTANRSLGKVKARLGELYSGGGGEEEDEEEDEDYDGEEGEFEEEEESAGDEFGEEEGDEVEGAESSESGKSFAGTAAAWVLGM
ncbi:MAG: SPOR domain-containing protein [Bacteroidales bacterium]